MSFVQPVAIPSVVFCTVCSLLILVLAAVGDQIVLAYFSVGRVIALYVVVIVSFCFPQLVDVSALSILRVFSAFRKYSMAIGPNSS